MTSIEIPLSNLKGSIAPNSASEPQDSAKIVDKNTRRVGITTMGCKVNTYESELISEALKTDNWQTVPSSYPADLYVINTCTVTQEADRQARREVRKVVKTNPDAIVVVTGCYAQMDSKACAEIPGVDLVLGNDRKLDLQSILLEISKGELPKVMVGDLDEHVSLPNELLAGYEAHTRAFIQIQQGCDQGCTFCIIHKARGPSRSLAPTLIKRQVERLALNGYPEIVICGVDLGSYGEDFESDEPFRLVDLIKELLAIEVSDNPDFRIRLSSIDPAHLTDDLIDLMANEPRFCPHIHLSLQSGSTLILKRMKRRYTREFVYERIQYLRKKVPELVMSSDVMVGFPTETEEQFQETKETIEDLDIAFPHIFTYSNRSGTPADLIPASKQVKTEIKKERASRLRESASRMQEVIHNARLGLTAWVLPEKQLKNEDVMQARSEDYLTVLIEDSQGIELGQWIQVKYIAVDGVKLRAKPV